MADETYRIPWQPLDLRPGAAFITSILNQNRQNDRADEYIAMQREAMKRSEARQSHEAKRQEEADKYKRSVEAFNAMPMLQRAAMRSVGLANTNPYGVRFEETYQQPDQGQADTEVSKFLNAEQAPQTTAPIPRQLRPNEEGPEQMPEAEAARFAPPEALMEQATTGAPMDLMSEAAVKSFGPPKRQISATFQGQRFDVPEQSDSLNLGPEYDTLYRNLLASGEDEDAARKYVLAEHKADRTQKNIADRTAANTAALIAGRDTSREDQQAFQAQQDAQYRRTFAQAMELARAAAARIDPSGGTDPQTMAALAEYALANPGDQPGLYREASRLGAKAPSKAVSTITSTTKPTESQAKDAKQAAIGLRAIDNIQRSNYVPDRATIQKWLDNQRDVYQATQAGEGGGISGFIGSKVAGGMQSAGLMAQSEVEGLSPQAADYFANVRRFMETIGRAQSGAAISQSEWTNFFNQYGPNSPGGLEAARKYMGDQLRASGVGGRSIAPGAGNQSAQTDALRAKAERALADPNAPPEAKAAARKILGR